MSLLSRPEAGGRAEAGRRQEENHGRMGHRRMALTRCLRPRSSRALETPRLEAPLCGGAGYDAPGASSISSQTWSTASARDSAAAARYGRHSTQAD